MLIGYDKEMRTILIILLCLFICLFITGTLLIIRDTRSKMKLFDEYEVFMKHAKKLIEKLEDFAKDEFQR
jgi:Na+-transporting NADH:ubiquinone oxidoreductase subunit NqrC